MVASSHLENLVYEALSYLINEEDFQRGDVTLGHMRRFETLLELFENLFKLKITDATARQNLKELRRKIQKHVETRNASAHSRLLLTTEENRRCR
jgi:hypothetical protein